MNRADCFDNKCTWAVSSCKKTGQAFGQSSRATLAISIASWEATASFFSSKWDRRNPLTLCCLRNVSSCYYRNIDPNFSSRSMIRHGTCTHFSFLFQSNNSPWSASILPAPSYKVLEQYNCKSTHMNINRHLKC